MSLIGDALKKARADTGSGSGLPPNVFAAPAPRRSNLPWIVAAAATSLAIGVLVGAAIFYRAIPTAAATGSVPISSPSVQADEGAIQLLPSDPSEKERVSPASGVPSPEPIGSSVLPQSRSEAATESASGLPGASRGETTEPRGGTGDEEVSESLAWQAELSQVEPPQGEPSQAQPSRASETTPAPARPAAAPGRAPVARDGESFVREVRLADGRTLNLTGIVWSDASPAALINGEVFSVGEGDGPWTVAELQRGEVTIEADGLRFSLRLK